MGISSHEFGNLNTSYFYDTDVTYGWGNRSFFTFFSEFNRSNPNVGYFEAAIYFLLMGMSLIGNVMVFVHLVAKNANRSVTTCFICNLTIADLFFSAAAPFVAVTRVTEQWVFGSAMCSMIMYICAVSGFVGIWTMTLISIDRYMCIVRRSKTRLTPRASVLILTIVWAFAFIAFTPMAVYFNVRNIPVGNRRTDICTLVWPKHEKIQVSVIFTSVICVCGFIIPLVSLTWSYLQIFRKFWKIRGVILQNQKSMNSPYMNSMNARRRRDIRDFKVVKTLFLLVILFCIMWAPIFIAMVLIWYDGSANTMMMSSQIFIATFCLAICNACVNPFVYGVMMERLRARLASCVTCSMSRSSTDDEPEDSPDKHDSVQVISYSGDACGQKPRQKP